MQKDVICIKMIGGDDLIGKVLNETTETIEMEHPAAIVIQRDQSGKMGVGLAPWAPFAESGRVTLFKNAIAARCNIDSALENEWSRLFGSGIQIASAATLAGLS